MTTKVRQIRITQLISMAMRGKNENELYIKSKSWGISNATAKDYVQTVKTMIASKKLKSKTNLF